MMRNRNRRDQRREPVARQTCKSVGQRRDSPGRSPLVAAALYCRKRANHCDRPLQHWLNASQSDHRLHDKHAGNPGRPAIWMFQVEGNWQLATPYPSASYTEARNTGIVAPAI